MEKQGVTLIIMSQAITGSCYFMHVCGLKSWGFWDFLLLFIPISPGSNCCPATVSRLHLRVKELGRRGSRRKPQKSACNSEREQQNKSCVQIHLLGNLVAPFAECYIWLNTYEHWLQSQAGRRNTQEHLCAVDMCCNVLIKSTACSWCCAWCRNKGHRKLRYEHLIDMPCKQCD